MHSWGFKNDWYNGEHHGVQTSNNWGALFRTYLRIKKGGSYRVVMMLGRADVGILFMNQVEEMRTNCREPAAVADFTFKDGQVIDLEILFQDDGWTDALVLMYQGPDTNDKLKVIPGHALLPHCGELKDNEVVRPDFEYVNEYVDVDDDNECKARTPKGTSALHAGRSTRKAPRGLRFFIF